MEKMAIVQSKRLGSKELGSKEGLLPLCQLLKDLLKIIARIAH